MASSRNDNISARLPLYIAYMSSSGKVSFFLQTSSLKGFILDPSFSSRLRKAVNSAANLVRSHKF